MSDWQGIGTLIGSSDSVTSDLLDKLNLRLEDEDNDRFYQDDKLGFLTDAQIEVASMLHNDLLSEFVRTESDVDLLEVGHLLTSFDSSKGVLKGAEGIVNVYLQELDKYATIKPFKEIKFFKETGFRGGSDTNPIAYVESGYLKLLIDTYTDEVIDIFHLQIPDDLTIDSVDPILNKAFHGILLDWAEAKAWKIDHKNDRAKTAMDSAINQINLANQRVGE